MLPWEGKAGVGGWDLLGNRDDIIMTSSLHCVDLHSSQSGSHIVPSTDPRCHGDEHLPPPSPQGDGWLPVAASQTLMEVGRKRGEEKEDVTCE